MLLVWQLGWVDIDLKDSTTSLEKGLRLNGLKSLANWWNFCFQLSSALPPSCTQPPKQTALVGKPFTQPVNHLLERLCLSCAFKLNLNDDSSIPNFEESTQHYLSPCLGGRRWRAAPPGAAPCRGRQSAAGNRRSCETWKFCNKNHYTGCPFCFRKEIC